MTAAKQKERYLCRLEDVQKKISRIVRGVDDPSRYGDLILQESMLAEFIDVLEQIIAGDSVSSTIHKPAPVSPNA